MLCSDLADLPPGMIYNPFNSAVKNPPALQETRVQSLGQEDPLEKEMATCSSILAWRLQGQRSLEGYSLWSLKSQ